MKPELQGMAIKILSGKYKWLFTCSSRRPDSENVKL
jgi:hypothetical protein